MTGLPSFKYGLIFDATNANGETFIIDRNEVCLFKIGDIEDYSKYEDYKSWLCIKKGHYGEDSVNRFDMVIRQYDDMGFLNPNYWVGGGEMLIEWKGGIYFAIKGSLASWATIDLQRRFNGELVNPHIIFYIEWEITKPEVRYVDFDYDYIDDFFTGYQITIQNPVYNIEWSYKEPTGIKDPLKYYHFCLYNIHNECVVDTGKVYTDTPSAFVCDSLDNKTKYKLVGYCVSQSGKVIDLPDLDITTAYITGRMYSNLSIELNKDLGENIISTELVNLVGKYESDDNTETPTYGKKSSAGYYDTVELTGTQNVTFTDNYNLMDDNFIIRLKVSHMPRSSLWTSRGDENEINKNVRTLILTLFNNDSSEYIKLYYNNMRFYAEKYSYGITSTYVSNAFTLQPNGIRWIYVSLLYSNGRIDIYAESERVRH